MGIPIRCRIVGCDLDDCGVCRRCGRSTEARHRWSEAEPDKPCYRREICERCGAERQQPDHDWKSGPSSGPDGVTLECGRCGLTI